MHILLEAAVILIARANLDIINCTYTCSSILVFDIITCTLPQHHPFQN